MTKVTCQLWFVKPVGPSSFTDIWSIACRKIGSTFVYTLFVRFGEECSNIAQEIAPVIEFYVARPVKSIVWSDWFIPLFGFSQWILLSQICVPSNCTTTPIPFNEHLRPIFNASCRHAKSEQTSNLNNLSTSKISLTGYNTNIFSILP